MSVARFLRLSLHKSTAVGNRIQKTRKATENLRGRTLGTAGTPDGPASYYGTWKYGTVSSCSCRTLKVAPYSRVPNLPFLLDVPQPRRELNLPFY